MDFVKSAIKRPVTIFVAMAIVIILGLMSITRMEMALLPDVEFPVAIVMTQYQGAGPEEVENLVTKPLESAVSNVNHLESVTSTSSEGLSLLVVSLDYGVDLDKAVSDIRDKIGMIQSTLPGDAAEPTIMKVDLNAEAVANIVVSSEGMSNDALKVFAEDVLKDRLERQAGVSSADITGGSEKEIRIEVSPERLEGLGLSMSTIAQVLAAENTNIPGGSVDYGENTMTISSILKMESLDEIKATPIRIGSGTVLQLQDFATITQTDKAVDSISRYNGKPAINIAVTKTSNANTVNTVKDVIEEIEALRKAYPNIEMEVVNESGSIIEDSVNNVISNIFIGAGLSIVTLFVFLKNIGLTSIIAISMPLSIIGTFVMLYFSGTTLNMVSLGGLSIGVGMLVDNSVVVLENIYRHRTTEKKDKIRGTYAGTKEVATAVAASTLTTVAVFVPFAFASGLVLKMMMDLALAVVFSLIMSLVVSITVVPMLSANYVNNVHRNHAPKRFDFINKLLNQFDKFIRKLDEVYQKSLRVALNNKRKTLLGILSIFALSLTLLPSIGMELMPASDEGTFTVTVEAPASSKIETIDALSLEVEKQLEELPELVSMTVSMSKNTTGTMVLRGGGGTDTSTIQVKLSDKTKRKRGIDEVIEAVRQSTKTIPGAKITVQASSNLGTMGGSGISIEIHGDNLEVLQTLSEQVEKDVAKIEGTRQINSSIGRQIQQIALNMDKDKIRQFNLTGAQVASQVRNTVSGLEATSLKVNEADIEVNLVYPKASITHYSDLKNINISTMSGAYIPLSSLATIELKEVPSSITRIDQSRYVTISSDVFGRSTGEVSTDIQKYLDQLQLPEGYTANLGGNTEMMNETFGSLFQVIILAMVLVYLVMAAQFESLVNPFVIMFTIPVAFTGAFFLLFLTGEPISMMALIGCLVLVGIVVNNGIILVDYITTLRQRDGMSLEEATLKACPTRLRPILMTALTTILGQVPVIFSNGSNSEMLKGMGMVIAGGLATSTFLTLFLVPILYIYFDRFNSKFRLRFKLKERVNRYEIESMLAEEI